MAFLEKRFLKKKIRVYCEREKETGRRKISAPDEKRRKTMKWMIASDIHGSAKYCGALLEAWEREQPDRVVLLGDLLYHGPRNNLPEGYAPKEVIAMLNGLAEKTSVICVRGNCDAEVDQMVLTFPILSDYLVLADGKRIVYATHGHLYHEETKLPLQDGNILLYGHTHVPLWKEVKTHAGSGEKGEKRVYLANPGSVSLPKEDSWHGYMIWEQGQFTWKDLDGTVKLHECLEN